MRKTKMGKPVRKTKKSGPQPSGREVIWNTGSLIILAAFKLSSHTVTPYKFRMPAI